MDHIIYTAASGAKQILNQQAVIYNNLANATTIGFRAQISAMYAVPVESASGETTRTAVLATTPTSDFSTGMITTTGRTLDVALSEDYWLTVQSADGSEGYTKRGDLQVDGNGILMSSRYPVIGDTGPVVIPPGAQLFVGGDGSISIISEGEGPEALVLVARLKLVNPGSEVLLRGKDGLFRLSPDDKGAPRNLPPDENGRLVSGALEGSNASPLVSMVAMIDNARRYEMQLKVIETIDENAERANGLLSLQR